MPPGPDQYYSIQATIKDPNTQVIGSIPDTKADVPISIASKLPLYVVVTAVLPGSVDDTDGAPLQFNYGADAWNTNDSGRCSVGGYENGNRDMDCNFAC